MNYRGGLVLYASNLLNEHPVQLDESGDVLRWAQDGNPVSAMRIRSYWKYPETTWQGAETENFQTYRRYVLFCKRWGIPALVRLSPTTVPGRAFYPPELAQHAMPRDRGALDWNNSNVRRRWKETLVRFKSRVYDLYPEGTIVEVGYPLWSGELRIDEARRIYGNDELYYGMTEAIEDITIDVFGAKNVGITFSQRSHRAGDLWNRGVRFAWQDGYITNSTKSHYESYLNHQIARNYITHPEGLTLYEAWGNDWKHWLVGGNDGAANAVGSAAVRCQLLHTRYKATWWTMMGWPIDREEWLADATNISINEYAPGRLQTYFESKLGNTQPPDPEPDPEPDPISPKQVSVDGGNIYGVAVTLDDFNSGIYNQKEHFPWVGEIFANIPSAVNHIWISAPVREDYVVEVESTPDQDPIAIWLTDDEEYAIFQFDLDRSYDFTASYSLWEPEPDPDPEPDPEPEPDPDLSDIYRRLDALERESNSQKGEIADIIEDVDSLGTKQSSLSTKLNFLFTKLSSAFKSIGTDFEEGSQGLP